MSRVIKFRVWDKDERRWVKNTGNPYVFPFNGKVSMTCAGNSTGYISDEDYSDDYELEQFTGLNDKLFVEIYDGDIFKDWQGKLSIVRWLSFRWVFEAIGEKDFKYRDGFHNTGEVVGNIHENPEQLVLSE